jgi:hypothetical protein
VSFDPGDLQFQPFVANCIADDRRAAEEREHQAADGVDVLVL